VLLLRGLVILLGLFLMAAAVVVFYRIVDEQVMGRRYDYTPDEIAQGVPCRDELLQHSNALVREMEARLGKQVVDRTSVRVSGLDLGPLQQDGLRQMTVSYYIDKISETVGPPKMATGMLKNDDCSFQLTTFQR
jgi:hypothetical protein